MTAHSTQNPEHRNKPSSLLFDDKARALNKHRIKSTFAQHDFLFRYICDDIIERLTLIKDHNFERILCLGDRFSVSFEDNLKEQTAAKEMIFCLPDYADIKDLEDKSFDCIIAPFSLHNINHLNDCLNSIRNLIKPKGLFLASLPGERTLHELRTSLIKVESYLKGGTTPRIIPFINKEQLGRVILNAGFILPVIDRDLLNVTYPDTIQLMHDLRYMGESNILNSRSRTNPGKAFFKFTEEFYKKEYTNPDGRITATFDLMNLIGWTKDDTD